ncbi:MAG TPA: diacylglycerol kinase [Peptococcaceae bacterium]|nr:MAG: Diacylglycerol kinase [Clostridia bacterium 41_269]HBT20296.1 diacylglycerol kinase [Peptococcaceae bacterium]
MMKSNTLKESFINAWEGLKYAVKTQKNMRIHLSAAFVVLLLSWLLSINARDFLYIVFAISFVLFAEMINTAVEKTVDLFMSTYHPLAKTAKNVAAGAVLIATINAVIVGLIILGKPLLRILISF